MATYTVTNKYLIDDFAVLQLLTPSEIAVGQSITVAGVDATFNGTYTVRALPQYLFIGVDTEGDLLYDYQMPIADQVLYARVETMSSAPPRLAPCRTTLCARGYLLDKSCLISASRLQTHRMITRCSRNRCRLATSLHIAGVRSRAILTP
jgi:hypothetical protein